MKDIINGLIPFVGKYPGVAILLLVIILGGFGYGKLQAEKVDRDDFEIVQKQIQDIDRNVDSIGIWTKTLYRAVTGEELKTDPPKLPPQEYLVGVDPDMLRNPFDSCLKGRVPDETGKAPWYCWCKKDTAGKSKVVKFKHPE